MPAYSFKRQFIPAMWHGTKLHTMRRDRKDGKVPKVGVRFIGCFGMRTKHFRRLFQTPTTKVQRAVIWRAHAQGCSVFLDGRALPQSEIQQLAKADGFDQYEAFMDFFVPTQGDKWTGHLIHFAVLERVNWEVGTDKFVREIEGEAT